MAGDPVQDAAPLCAAALALKDVAVDARLDAVLQEGQSVEGEAQRALAVLLADGVREQVSDEALLIAGVCAIGRSKESCRGLEGYEGSKRPEWSQLDV